MFLTRCRLDVAIVRKESGEEAVHGEHTSLVSVTICNTLVHIQKRFALSPRLFSKATEMFRGIFKSVSPVNNVEILSLCL